MTVETLRCDACGASEPLADDARREGWYRCGFCETPRAAPLAEAEAFEGPESRVVLLTRPDRHGFILPPGSVCGTTTCAAGIFIAWSIGFFLAGAFQLNDPGHPLRLLGPPLVLAAAAAVTWMLVRARRASQHIEVGPDVLEVYRRVGRARHAARRFEVDPGTIRPRVIETTDNGWGKRVHKVRIELPGRPFDVSCSGEREARWLAAMVARAQSADRGSADATCDACGAPLPIALADRAQGDARCTHCDAGFVVGGRGIASAPVRLPRLGDPAGEPPARVAIERGADRTDVVITPGLAPLRLFWGAGLLANTALFGGFALAMWLWLLPLAATQESDPAPPALLAYMVLVGAMFAGIAAFATAAAAMVVFGRRRVRLREGSASAAVLLGGRPAPGWLSIAPLESYRQLFDGSLGGPFGAAKGSGPPRPREPQRPVALMRLQQVRFGARDGGTEAELVSPAGTLRLRWVLPEAADRWLRAWLVAELRARLRALGRPVAE